MVIRGSHASWRFTAIGVLLLIGPAAFPSSGNADATPPTRTFDRAGRLTTVDNAKSGTSLSKFLWTLDAGGNPTKQQTTRGGTDTYDVYAYDTRNRLTDSCFGVSSGTTTCSGATNAITYSYDKVSNRTQEVRAGSVGNTGTIDYAYNSSDQLTGTTKSGTTRSYTYDANGNPATAGSKSFTYGLVDRLVSAASGGTTTTYAYDGAGRRVSASASGGTDLRFVWDPLADSGVPELALERTGAGTFVRSYLNGPAGAVGFTNSSASFYYHRDPLETVTDLTNASGVAQWKYEYEAYGGERSATDVSGSAPVSKLRFQGQYLDAESTLYHLRARQYDPATGRFGGLDPVENPVAQPYVGPYVYVDGRPTTAADPLGLCLWGACDTAGDLWGWGHDQAGGAMAAGDALLTRYVDPALRRVVTPIAGFGDAASLGLTNEIRDWMGTNDVVDKCSGWYTAGKIAGYGALATLSGLGLAARSGQAGLTAAKAGSRQLPAGAKIPLGNAKQGLEHILRRHKFNTLTMTRASKFSRGMGQIEIRRTVREAVARGGPWRVEGPSRVLDTSLGRTIGTDLAGNPTSGLRVVTDEAGSVITSYPIPWP